MSPNLTEQSERKFAGRIYPDMLLAGIHTYE